MKNLISSIINIFAMVFKVNNRKILFECGRNMVDGNPKALYSYIKENCPSDFKTIWIVNKNADVSELEKGDFVYHRSLSSFYHLTTSKYWIRSESLGSIIKKKKNQVYIQAWHGHGALKKMGYDIKNDKERPIMDHVKEWDYFISSDPLDEQVIITSTGYNKKTVMLGAPCTDEILKISQNEEQKKNIKYKLGITEKNFNKKVIFYAPTFRDNALLEGKVDLPISCLLNLKDVIIIIRLHPLIGNKIDRTIFKDNVIDACSYPDASEILAISDILISDYSSIVYEFAILNRPIIFYAYDLDYYLKERGLYLNYQTDLPGPIAYTQEELYNFLVNIKQIQVDYKASLDKFNKKYNYLNDGQVCKRTVQKLKEGFFTNE